MIARFGRTRNSGGDTEILDLPNSGKNSLFLKRKSKQIVSSIPRTHRAFLIIHEAH